MLWSTLIGVCFVLDRAESRPPPRKIEGHQTYTGVTTVRSSSNTPMEGPLQSGIQWSYQSKNFTNGNSNHYN